MVRKIGEWCLQVGWGSVLGPFVFLLPSIQYGGLGLRAPLRKRIAVLLCQWVCPYYIQLHRKNGVVAGVIKQLCIFALPIELLFC